MYDIRTQQKLKWWPSLQDYNEAIQIPMVSLQDGELKKGMPYTSALGLPRPISGAFATVYRMHCDKSDYALRLFLRNIEDQAQRYARISNFVQHDNLPYTVTFDFLEKGIKTRSDWFPALKMEWVEGTPFEEYLIENLNNPQKLGALLKSFVKMMDEMRFAGIAHGDLQHGNIIIRGNEIRLVDYDGMFVPAMKKYMATELGHPNFQHPGRAAHHFGPYLDNFSAWVIYASIRALQIDPGLLNQLGGGDDCLLFRQSDFKQPLESPAFAAFEKHKNEELQLLGRFVRAQLAKDVVQVPYLQLPLPGISTAKMAPIYENVSTIKSGPRIERNYASNEASDWLRTDNVGAILKPGMSRLEPGDVSPANQDSWVVQHNAPQPSVWIKPTAPNVATRTNSAPLVAPPPQSTAGIPLILVSTQTPRPVVFDKRVGLLSPQEFQWLMICCPFFWLMVFYFYQAYTTDKDLLEHATTYDAKIQSVVRYDTNSKSSVIHHTDVDSVYRANGKDFYISADMYEDGGKFKKGDVYPVRALPSNPSITERYGARAGAKQREDLSWAYANLIFQLIIEIWIWCKPLWHRYLAKHGIPAIATVHSATATPGPKGSMTYTVTISYIFGSKKEVLAVNPNAEEFNKLQPNTTEIILIHPTMPDSFVFYKFCLYKVNSPKTPSISSSSSSLSHKP